MMERFRAFWTNIFKPVGDLLLRLGVSPDAVTLVGTLGVSAGALIFFPRGQLLIGVLVITAFVFSDMVDGYMARTSGRVSTFGNFLDSTLDRIGDAAVFGGLVLYYAGTHYDGAAPQLYLCLSLYCLVMGSVTSYARAKAESLGMEAKGGIAERSDRLVAILVMTGLNGIFGWEWLTWITLWALAAGTSYTVVFRVLKVRRQATARDAAAGQTPVTGSSTGVESGGGATA